MRATLADNRNWTYDEIRPLYPPASWKPGQKVSGDCSKGCQYLTRWAGAPDCMRNQFAGWGNSQTMWLVLEHVPVAAELEIGDCVVFGPDGDAHATMVLEPGPDPLLWSFGHQGAPDSYRLNQDGRPATFLKLFRDPPPKPSPDELLREHTGFYSWVAWRLGEGPWKHKAPRDASVRPNVPRLISPAWWLRYRRFLANRQKPNAASRHTP